MENNAIELLESVLRENNIVFNDDIKNKLDVYYQMLIDYNEKINLTAITKYDDVYIKHFTDSALFSAHYKTNASVCDIGTGAGFPGLLLKIIRPDLNVTLVDSLNKRIIFLNDVIKKLNLNGIQCLHYRAEDIEFKNKYLNSFDYVIARAVAQMPTLTEYCLPYVKVGGQFIAYKSDNIEDELNNAKKCIHILGGKFKDIETVLLNEDIKRKFIIIEKINKCEQLYPRGMNKPRLKPLI